VGKRQPRKGPHRLRSGLGLRGSEAESLAFVDDFFLGSADLLFGLEPVIELRAGFVAALDVEFVGAALDSLAKGSNEFDAYAACGIGAVGLNRYAVIGRPTFQTITGHQ